MSEGASARFRRILVAEAPVRPVGERRARPWPCHVGVLPWVVDRCWLSIIVAATYRFDPRAAERPIPLVPAPARRFHTGSYLPESPRADDFVPMRLLVDLTVSGHVDLHPLPSGAPPSRRLQVGLGARRVDVIVHPSQPGRVPLRAPLTQTLQGRPIDLAAQPCHEGAEHRFIHEAEFDLSVYQAAVPELRWEPEAVKGIHLAGFWADPERSLDLALPALTPRARVDYAQAGVRRGDVRFFLDGVAVNVDTSLVHVTWRGLVETTAQPHLDVDRIVLGWAPPARWDADPEACWDDCLRELPRGRFHWAIEREDARRGEDPPALGDEELAMARYETWRHPKAAMPELAPEDAARIAAELAEQRWPRAEVLARHGTDDYAWAIEERAWAQHPSADYAAALQQASDALATPREEEITAAQYVALAARLTEGDPSPMLAAAGLGIAAFVRVERRFRTRAAEDPELAAELERLRLDEARRRGSAAAAQEGQG